MAKFRAIYNVTRSVVNDIEFDGTAEELEKHLEDHAWDEDGDDLPYKVLQVDNDEGEQVETFLVEVQENDDGDDDDDDDDVQKNS